MKDIEEPDCMIRYEGDTSDERSVDELSVRGNIEIERMDENTFWGRITMDDGTQIELHFCRSFTGNMIMAEVY